MSGMKMNLKGKLITLIILITGILGFVAGNNIWNLIKNIQEIQIVGSSFRELEVITTTISDIDRQIISMMNYFISINDQDKNDFEQAEAVIKNKLKKWRKSEEEIELFGFFMVKEKSYHRTHDLNLEAIYEETVNLARQAMERTRSGGRDKGFDFFENEFEPWMYLILLENINNIKDEEIRRIEKSYDQLLVNLGIMPWVTKKSLVQVEISKTAISRYKSMIHVYYSGFRQMKETLSYLIIGTEKHLRDFEEFDNTIKTFLYDYYNSLSPEENKGEEKIKEAMEATKIYVELLNKSRAALELRKKGKTDEAVALARGEITVFFNEVWLPRLNKIIDENREKMAVAHKKLFDTAVFSGIQSIAFLSIIYLSILFFMLRLIRGIIRSLKEIHLGTQGIASGNLDYRINLNTQDELGDLAAAFNHMSEDLVFSREQIRKEHAELNSLFKQVEFIKKEWEKTLDCLTDMIILVDQEGRVKRCNLSLRIFSGKIYSQIIDEEWKKLFFPEGEKINYQYGENFEYYHAPIQRWFIINSYVYHDSEQNDKRGIVVSIRDITKLKQAYAELEKNKRELERAYEELKNTQSKILHQEKMASVGVLAAGVAHEINNPMSFISSNLNTLQKYIADITKFLEVQSLIIESNDLDKLKKELDLDFIMQDLPPLIKESLEGAERVKKIVLNLKSFSRVDETEFKASDVNECLENTISIAWNELKYKVTLKKDFGKIPHTKCYAQELNQVFLNLLINAAQAIEKKGEITIRTLVAEGGFIHIIIADTGCGISEKNLVRIFEPFFTTKTVGKGTGLGLSISYDIIKKHQGEISVRSEVGKGTEFTIKIPITN